MGDLIVNLQQESNWSQVWSDHVFAQPVDGNPSRRTPIRTITVPILLESSIIALFIDSDTAAPHWSYAGMLRQIVSTGLSVGGLTNAFTYQQKVYLFRINILTLPKYATQYALSLRVPGWIIDLRLNLFEYTGLVTDTTATTLVTLEEDIARLESKIDEL